MADGGAAEIYGYARGRWRLLDAVAGAPRDEVLHRGRTCFARADVQAVRILVERMDGSGMVRSFVAYRAQKSDDIPEFDLIGPESRARRRPRAPADNPDGDDPDGEVADGPPPIPPFLVPDDRRPRWRSGHRVLRGALAGAATLCLGFLAVRHGAAGAGTTHALAPSAAAVTVLIAAGLLLARDLTRLELPTAPGGMPDPRPEPETETETEEYEREAAAAPGDASADASGPGPAAPVLRLLADALARIDGEMPDAASDEPVRLAIRIYAAGAAEEHAGRLGGPAGRDPVADCMMMLGERENEALRFAAALDDLLLVPEAQALHRAGREDLTALLDGSGETGTGLAPAFASWLHAAANDGRGDRQGGGRGGNLVVLAVAPLPPDHAQVIEAVIGAFGGAGFTRNGTAVTAGFHALDAALDAAHAIRDAVRTSLEPGGAVAGCGLTIAVAPRPGGTYPAPAASAALALARAAPGEVAATPVLRTVLAARGMALDHTPLRGIEGYVLAEGS